MEKPYTLNKLTENYGAEIIGLDLNQDIKKEVIEQIK